MFQGMAVDARTTVREHTLFNRPLLLAGELLKLCRRAWKKARKGQGPKDIPGEVRTYVCKHMSTLWRRNTDL